jgi:hypothetical protein
MADAKEKEPIPEAIRKLSKERLIAKLIGAGLNEEDVLSMDRPTLMQTWHECTLKGEVVTGVPKLSAYDVELERERLGFEKRKWEEELELRREEARMRRLEIEAKERMDNEMLHAKRMEEDRKNSVGVKMKRFADALRCGVAPMGSDIL